jgi:heme/copper-type cytochrome/quinol oxidase subunit 4
MVTDSSGDKKPKLVHVGLGLVILLALIAVVVSVSSIGTPYDVVLDIACYAMFVAAVTVQLWICLRLAKGSEYSATLKLVAFLVVLAVIPVVTRLGDILRTENRDYLRLATNGGTYFALFFSLRVVQSLLMKVAAKSQPGHAPGSPAETAGSSAPNPSLQQKGSA